MNAWVDSHCHLNHSQFDHDLTQILQHATDKGIHKFVVPGTHFQTWSDQQKIEQTYPNVFAAYGIHPWFCDLHDEQHIEQLDNLLVEAVAVGECGLDLSPNKPDLKKQMYWFDLQLKLATKHQLPVIIHSVRAAHLVLEVVKPYPSLRGVVHGFSGNIQQAQAFIKKGFFVGIGTRLINTTSQKTDDLLTEISLKHILLETDAPDGLGKNKRNEPTGLIEVAHTIAKLHNLETNQILDICSKNAEELFQI